MSFQAMAWAAARKWGGCSGRATIYAIANHANDMFFCWARQETLADESEQSIDSVGRRISEFVAEGELRRIKLKRFGRRTHDFLILKPSPYFGATIKEIEPFVPKGCEIMLDETPRETETHAAANCGSVNDGQNAAASKEVERDAAADCGSIVHGLTLPQPAAHAAALVREQEPLSEPFPIPQRPLSVHGEAAGSAKGADGQDRAGTDPPSRTAGQQAPAMPADAPDPDQRLAKQLAAFRAAFPEPSNRPGEVAAAFAALSEDDRRLALRAAIGAGVARRKNPRKALPDQIKFLRSRELLDEYARLAPAEVEFVTIAPETPEWHACALMRGIIGLVVEPGATFQVRAPLPDARQLAGIDARDRGSWVIVARDSKPFIAWAGLAKKWTGRWPEAQRIYLDDAGRPVPRERAAMSVLRLPGGREQRVPKFEIGLLVPSEWPPRRDGSTGPPDDAPAPVAGTLMTEADLQEFPI